MKRLFTILFLLYASAAWAQVPVCTSYTQDDSLTYAKFLGTITAQTIIIPQRRIINVCHDSLGVIYGSDGHLYYYNGSTNLQLDGSASGLSSTDSALIRNTAGDSARIRVQNDGEISNDWQSPSLDLFYGYTSGLVSKVLPEGDILIGNQLNLAQVRTVHGYGYLDYLGFLYLKDTGIIADKLSMSNGGTVQGTTTFYDFYVQDLRGNIYIHVDTLNNLLLDNNSGSQIGFFTDNINVVSGSFTFKGFDITTKGCYSQNLNVPSADSVATTLCLINALNGYVPLTGATISGDLLVDAAFKLKDVTLGTYAQAKVDNNVFSVINQSSGAGFSLDYSIAGSAQPKITLQDHDGVMAYKSDIHLIGTDTSYIQDASHLITGALPDARLSANVVKTVALNTPSVIYTGTVTFTTSGNTATGTLTLKNQNPNTFFAGATSGITTPTFRTIANADLPASGAAGTYGSSTAMQVTTYDGKGLATGQTTVMVACAVNSTTYTPTVVGYSVTPTILGRYTQYNNVLEVWVSITGTSSANNLTFTLPNGKLAAYSWPEINCKIVNAGTASSAIAIPTAGSNIITVNNGTSSSASNTFGTSGNKRVEIYLKIETQ